MHRHGPELLIQNPSQSARGYLRRTSSAWRRGSPLRLNGRARRLRLFPTFLASSETILLAFPPMRAAFEEKAAGSSAIVQPPASTPTRPRTRKRTRKRRRTRRRSKRSSALLSPHTLFFTTFHDQFLTTLVMILTHMTSPFFSHAFVKYLAHTFINSSQNTFFFTFL